MELQTALDALIQAVLAYPATSNRFLYDVCKVMCSIESKLGRCTKGALPSSKNMLPEINDTLLQTSIFVVCQPAYNKFAASLYMYIHAVKAFKRTITVTLTEGGGNNTAVLKQIMARYATECKFKKTSDLFIWILLYLKLPQWTILAQQKNERPYSLVSDFFEENTNSVVHPLIKETVDTQLKNTSGYEQFCIIAALALELTNHDSTIAISHTIIQQNPTVPTFAVVKPPYITPEPKFGFVHHSIFHTFNDPFHAVQQWAIAVDASSAFSEVCSDETVVSHGNPFLKFVQGL